MPNIKYVNFISFNQKLWNIIGEFYTRLSYVHVLYRKVIVINAHKLNEIFSCKFDILRLLFKSKIILYFCTYNKFTYKYCKSNIFYELSIVILKIKKFFEEMCSTETEMCTAETGCNICSCGHCISTSIQMAWACHTERQYWFAVFWYVILHDIQT